MTNLMVEVEEDIMRKAKVKAAMIDLSLKDYIAGLIDADTNDIKIKRKKNEEDNN